MPIKLTVKMTPDAADLAKQFGRRAYKQKVDEGLEKLSKKINRNIQEEAPEKTGKLKKAHRQHKLRQFEYEGYVDGRTKASKYYPYVVGGTRAHVIRPRRKKALMGGNLRHPIRRANHPGARPNNYVDRGINRSSSDIQRIEKELAVAVEKELLGG